VAKSLRSFDHQGVTFWDLTSITYRGHIWRHLIDAIATKYRGEEIDMIVGLDARGFFFSGALGYAMGIGMVPIRKKGKLPGKTFQYEYRKEYEGDGDNNLDIFEIQDLDYIKKGARVLVVDDVLATGGTAKAACELVEAVGGEVVGLAFGIELPFLAGRSQLVEYPITSEISILDGKPYGNVKHCVDMIGLKDPELLAGELILVDRLNNPTGLALPGGKIDFGQSIRQAAQREYGEETGFSCQMLDFQAVLANANRDYRDGFHHVSHVVTVAITGGKRKGEGHKTKVVEWPTTGDVLPGHEQFALDHGHFLSQHWKSIAPDLRPKEAA